MLLEQDEHWQLEGRRMVSAESMAAIPEWRISLPCCTPPPPEQGNSQAPAHANNTSATGRKI